MKKESMKHKTYHFFILVTISLLTSCLSQKNLKNDQGFIITGSIDGITSGEIGLQFSLDSQPIISKIVNGKFKFSGKVKEPQIAYISIPSRQIYISFFIENSNIELSLDETKKNSAENGIKMNVAGSKSHTESESFNKSLSDKLTSFTSDRTTTIVEHFSRYIKQNPESVVAAYSLRYFIGDLDYQQFKDIIDSFKGSVIETDAYKKLKTDLSKLEKIQVGQVAPDFTLKTPENNQLSISSLKGKYILIDFWASWCVPCRQSFPHLKSLYTKYQSKGLQILSISSDRSEEDWRSALEEDQLPWLQGIEAFHSENNMGNVSNLYFVFQIPYMILLDKEGKIIAKDLHGEELDMKLAEIFN